MLRQTFPGNSQWCYIDDNNSTVDIKVFESTFSKPNTEYYIKIENNFVASLSNNEPLLGNYIKSWFFTTKSFKSEYHIQSTSPAIGEVIDPTIGEFTIKYNILAKLLLANISIIQRIMMD